MKKYILLFLLLPFFTYANDTDMMSVKYSPFNSYLTMHGRLNEPSRAPVGFLYYAQYSEHAGQDTGYSIENRGIYEQNRRIIPDIDKVCVKSYVMDSKKNKYYSNELCTFTSKCYKGVSFYPIRDKGYVAIVSMKDRIYFKGSYAYATEKINKYLISIGRQNLDNCGVMCHKGAEIHYDYLFKTYWAKDLNGQTLIKNNILDIKQSIESNQRIFELDMNPQCTDIGYDKTRAQIILGNIEVKENGDKAEIQAIFEIQSPKDIVIDLDSLYLVPSDTSVKTLSKTTKILSGSRFLKKGDKTRIGTAVNIQAVRESAFNLELNPYSFYTVNNSKYYFDNIDTVKSKYLYLNTEIQGEESLIKVINSNILKTSYKPDILDIELQFEIIAKEDIYIKISDLYLKIRPNYSADILDQDLDIKQAEQRGLELYVRKGEIANILSTSRIRAKTDDSIYAYLSWGLSYSPIHNPSYDIKFKDLDKMKTNIIKINK